MNIIKILGVVTVVVILYSVQATAQMREAQEAMQCVEKLSPCQPYIHSEIPPPPWCCSPMKEIAEKNATCLCIIFNHPEVLGYIDLTKENALNLLKSCGANYNVSLCTDNASSSSSTSYTTKNAALAISLLGFSFLFAVLRF